MINMLCLDLCGLRWCYVLYLGNVDDGQAERQVQVPEIDFISVNEKVQIKIFSEDKNKIGRLFYLKRKTIFSQDFMAEKWRE